MFKNYFKIAIRNLIKQKTFSIINILGFSFGLACFILILLWVKDEVSYDRFHDNKNEIYRITVSANVDNKRVKFAFCPRPLAKVLKKNVPGIVNISTFSNIPTEVLVRQRDKKFYEKNVSVADPTFFQIFSFKFLTGDTRTALKYPNSIVLTQHMAQKYFGHVDIINENIEVDGILHKITGVIENVPAQSHIQFDFLTSYHLLERYTDTGWNNLNYPYYIQVQKNVDIQRIIPKINELVRKNTPQLVSKLKLEFSLQSLLDIHLNSADYSYEYSIITDRKIVNVIAFIACLILLIACTNYMSLSTAVATNRAKEIGLRKVIGTNKSQLFTQFLGECILFSFIAYLFALILVELFLPSFNQLCHKTLYMEYFNQDFILSAIGLVLLVGIISGSYPAFFLSSLKPVNIFKSNTVKAVSGNMSRKILVVAQFSISIGLIICAIFVSQQFHFLLNKDLGFDQNNIIYLPVKGQVAEHYQAIKNDLLTYKNVINISASECLPTSDIPNQTIDINWEGNTSEYQVVTEIHRVDYDYFQVLNLKLLEGRFFSESFKTDARNAYILNEEAVKQMGIESPVGKTFSLWGRQGEIIGVIRDAYYHSLQNKITPQLYTPLLNLNRGGRGVILIKIKENKFQEMAGNIAAIKKVMMKHNPDFPFEYHFLDKNIEQFYKHINQLNTIFKYFTLLAASIACLGLFGLAMFTVEKRTKEIGVRKVLGAPVHGILYMLTKDFSKWILIANVVAWPIAYFAMNKWLQNFSYRVDLTIWPFLLAGLSTLVIALLTVSWQAVRVATANPVESLRYE